MAQITLKIMSQKPQTTHGGIEMQESATIYQREYMRTYRENNREKYNKYQNEYQKKRRGNNWKKGICKTCNKNFVKVKGTQKYCNQNCFNSSRKKYMKEFTKYKS